MKNKTMYIIAGLLVAGAAGYFLYKKYQAKKTTATPSLKENIESEKTYRDDDRANANDMGLKDLLAGGKNSSKSGGAVTN